MSDQILDKNKIYKEASELNQIEIIPSAGPSIKGLLQEQLKYSVEANYQQIMHMDNLAPDVNKLANLTLNRSLFGTGIATKRYYKGGSYLRLEPKLRVVDWVGSGNVIFTAAFLMNMCLPSNHENVIGDNIAKLIEDFIEAAKVANATVGKLDPLIQQFVPFAPNGTATAVTAGAIATELGGWEKGMAIAAGSLFLNSTLGTEISDASKGIAKELARTAITNNPWPVHVKISNYFDSTNVGTGFVVESVQVEFSKEMTETGPLYGDFSLVLSSQEVITAGNTGFGPSRRTRLQVK